MHVIRVAYVLTLAALACGCSFSPEASPQSEGVQAAQPVIEALKAHRTTHGQYPSTLEALQLPTDVMAAVIRAGIGYFPEVSGSSYTMGFDPPGPAFLCAYGEGGAYRSQWSCLVK